MRFWIGVCAFLSLIASAAFADEAARARPAERLLWVPLNRTATFEVIRNAYREGKTDGGPKLTTLVAPIDWRKPEDNPFAISNYDFELGESRPDSGGRVGAVPSANLDGTKWFDRSVLRGPAPRLFLIGGHHVISEGWHNNEESGFLFMPTLLDTIANSRAARAAFASIRFAFLGGCNTMTNLEPHAADGSYLRPSEIERIYRSGGAGRSRMIGSASIVNSFEFYKARLAREYGPGTKQYEYTRRASAEKCLGPGRYENCKITNLERILPETMLYDGEHLANEPARMKLLFPNAYLVLGFSSASPPEEVRAKIFADTLADTRRELDTGSDGGAPVRILNPIQTIVADETPSLLRERVIESVRRNWTRETYRLNGFRPSGSITPALPKLDRNGVFNIRVSADSPLYRPYESR